jgi:hypothetical protein
VRSRRHGFRIRGGSRHEVGNNRRL